MRSNFAREPRTVRCGIDEEGAGIEVRPIVGCHCALVMPLSLVGRDSQERFYAACVTRFGGPVLVLGSADGTLVFALATKGQSIVGIEPSPFLMTEAEAKKA